MSTRKSVNKQQNSDATVTSSQDTTTLRLKQQNQDAGSESSEAPSTPTSKDSNQTVPTTSKRKRRTNSTLSVTTPKRSTSEAGDSSTNDISDKSSPKEGNDEKNNTQTDSPRTRKRNAPEKSNTTSTTTATRKSIADASKNLPLRTSARAKYNAAKKKASPSEVSTTPKRGRKKKVPDSALSTPIKRERSNSNQSENDMEEIPDIKRVKIEKDGDEDEDSDEEILMEIRTEILDEIRAKENVEVIEIKDEKLIDDESMIDSIFANENVGEKSQDHKSIVDSTEKTKDDEVLLLITPEKVVTIDSDECEKPGKLKPETKSKRPTRRKPVIAKAVTKQRGRKKVLPEKKEGAQPAKRGRKKKVCNVGRKPTVRKKAIKATENTSPSTVPKNAETVKTEVPECTEDDDANGFENVELIFSTTTDPVNRDNRDHSPHEHLIIDTTTQNSDSKESIPSTECTAGSEKSVSLSPVELESEGVSAISVKQFYKEPEFLENNLGIEKDPTLGGIVQHVENDTVEKTVIKTECADSGDIKESSSVDTKSQQEQQPTVDTVLPGSDSPVTEAALINPEEIVEERISSESVEATESDSLKEGELLILEDSTEEELSQKTELEPPMVTLTNIKLERHDEPAANNDVTGTTVEEKEGIIKSVQMVEEKALTEDTYLKAKIEIKVESECETTTKEEINKLHEDKKKNEPIVQSEEVTKNVTEQTLFDGDAHVTPNVEKDVVENESTAMEIDSGVSDVAENNSNDPNEDLSLSGDIIVHTNQKTVINDDNAVNTVVTNIEAEKTEKGPIVSEVSDAIVGAESTVVEANEPKDEIKDISPIAIRKVQETPETLKEKENHLKTLGLLTIKAADEAKIEKQKLREQLSISTPSTSKRVNGGSSCAGDSSSSSGSGSECNSGNGNDNGTVNSGGSNENSNKTVHEYTGTLKTVIKLNRPLSTAAQSQSQMVDKKKINGSSGSYSSTGSRNTMSLLPASSSNNTAGRHPLKITLQKGRARGSYMERNANGSHHSHEETTYYTIQNESETGTQETVTHGRKSHHYRFNIDQNTTADATGADKKEVLIPEKASSFAIHPGRLCQDQCYYCGGKFGLYDTPCHVAQLKSAERQKKILENEEKLTVDNCLCDACFRHLDRRANSAAAQKKRLSAAGGNVEANSADQQNASVGDNELSETGASHSLPIPPGHSLVKSMCFVTNCGQRASHTFRRKGFRKTIRKLLGNDIDLTNMGGRLPICDKHYEIIIQCLECALCKRRLIKNHMHHITQDIQLLESLLVKQGIPVKLQANPAVCKLCRYFTNLLLKPPEGKTQKAQFVKNYRKRLLHFHNIQQSDDGSEVDEQNEIPEQIKSQPTVPAKRGRKPKQQISNQQNEKPEPPRKSPGSYEDGSSNDVVALEMETSENRLASSGQMQLDNDVMVDYDVPVICDSPSPPAAKQTSQPPSKLQTILQGGAVAKSNDDISLALRSNPNISMRELFPGEEEMGLQVNVPFGSSSSHRTPEGWTRVQTFLQYDEPTRRLWEDLQKPYGNQSSFLRHLILLEKYYRNGDLVLSQNASTTAVAYSETVQNRLHSFDHSTPVTGGTSKKSNNATGSGSSNNTNNSSESQKNSVTVHNNFNLSGSMAISSNNVSNDRITGSSPQSGILTVPEPIRKLHNNLTITITPKTKLIPETAQAAAPSLVNINTKTATSGSILKTNLLSRKNSAIEIIPIASGMNSETTPRPPVYPLTKQQKLLAAANQLMGEDKTPNVQQSTPTTAANPNLMKHINLPPELISINRSNPGSLLIASRPASNFPASNFPASMKPKTHSTPPLSIASQRTGRMPPTIIKLSTQLTQQERMTSKHWRPTLMPINSGPIRSAPGVLYQTADGRKLPSLVQVQSGGKPYLISIHDYNRMCILRREKLLRDQMMKNGKMGGSAAGSSSSNANSLLKGALSAGISIHSSVPNSTSTVNTMNMNSTLTKSMLSHGKQW